MTKTNLHLIVPTKSNRRRDEWSAVLDKICPVFSHVHMVRSSCWEEQVNIDFQVKAINAYGSTAVAVNSLWVVDAGALKPPHSPGVLLDPARVWSRFHYSGSASVAITEATLLGCLSGIYCEPEGASEVPNPSGKSIKRTCNGHHQESILAKINAAATQLPENRVNFLWQSFGAMRPDGHKRPMYQWINLGKSHFNSGMYFHAGKGLLSDRSDPHSVYGAADKRRIIPACYVTMDGSDFKGQNTFSVRHIRGLTLHGHPDLGVYCDADELVAVVTEFARLKDAER